MTAVTLAPAPTTTDGDGHRPAIVHYYCSCDRDLGLCGKDISDLVDYGVEPPPADEQVCVVCDEISFIVCGRCGG